MTAPCANRLTWAQLVDYWAGDLPAEQQDALDEHLIGCEPCTAESMRVAAVTETMRSGMLPPIVSLELVEKLKQRGLSVLEKPIYPGERKEVLFPNAVDVLLHCLTGMPLEDAVRVDFKFSSEDGEVLIEAGNVPFDRATGSVRIACMKHYPGPADAVAETRVTDSTGAQTVHVFTILHRYEQAR